MGLVDWPGMRVEYWLLRYCNSISFTILITGKCKVGQTFKMGRMI
jgi:hypothetical protein